MEEQMRTRALVVVGLLAWFTGISILVTGYNHIYGHNHAYQLVLVQKLNQPDLYPHDPLAEAVYYYASVFWYGVAFLARFVNLSLLLFILFVISKMLFVLAGYCLGRTFFPSSNYTPFVGMILMAITPQLLFGGGYVTNYTQQTLFAIALLLLALDAFLNKRWGLFALCLGLGINMNMMFSIYGITYLMASLIAYRFTGGKHGSLWKALASFAGALVIGTPGFYLVFRAIIHDADYNPISVWQTAELSYPYHFYPQLWQLPRQLLALFLAGVVILTVYRFPNASPVGMHLVLWTGVGFIWYLLGWSSILIHSLPLLHLHPVRALVLWQLLSMLFITNFIINYLENINLLINKLSSYVYLFYLFLLLIISSLDKLQSRLLLVLIGLTIIVSELGRLILKHRASKYHVSFTVAAFITITFAIFVSLYATGAHLQRIRRSGNLLGIEQYPAYQIAAWAKEKTAKEEVFLVPTYFGEGWGCFRHLAQRSVFTRIYDGVAWPFAPWFAETWLERIKALGFYESWGIDEKSYTIGDWIHIWSSSEENYVRAYEQVDEKRVRTLRSQYRIDYWITKSSTPTSFPTVYQLGEWKVVRVSE
jgi:hypothetical protein